MANFARRLIVLAFLARGAYAVDYHEVANYWRQAVTAEKDFALGFVNLAFAEFMLEDYESSALDYKKADAISQSLNAKAGVQWALLAAEKNGESIEWGQAALQMDPQNFWVRQRLGVAYAAINDTDTAQRFFDDLAENFGSRALTSMPHGAITPYFHGINFSGSSQKTSGFDSGTFAFWNFNSGFSLGGGYAINQIGKPNATDIYDTREVKAQVAKTFNNVSALTLTGHILSSNYSYLDKAWSLSLAWRPRFYSNLTVTGSVLSFPLHGGFTLEPQYTIPFNAAFSLSLGASGQIIAFSTTTSVYAAAQASLRFCHAFYCLSAGGLYGSLYTPIFESGTILLYGLDQLTSQAFAKIAVNPLSWLQFSAGYSYGIWKSFTGETPSSSAISFTATGTLW